MKNPPPYLVNNQPFIPGESTIWYSGQYWDEKEILAAIDSILNGKWITAGEKVNQFERK